ncbi:hypothetical protein BOTBODRAFT_411318 [Botryobasidium botryosum FD-172 SS1]|uniref:Uncharacterized protein n=1 Tax=Botryobasidium botryosum (strain FD-172 SS1) TaxID=930990 RepID=A0A067MAS4_BOTB1|nr:hypothetical protein BOTBODRAFT_411318 [Botryobasidium botryosum FD-172 SS1]
MAPSNDSPEVQETELRSRAPPSEGASGKAREDTGSPNDHLTPSFTPLDEEDGEDHDDGDELVESEGGVDTPNGKIIWSTKLTWKLINAIKDDPIVRKEIFLPFGSGIARYKSLHYTRLANIVFGDSVTYGKRFKAYKEESRIKKNKFIQAVVNKLRK